MEMLLHRPADIPALVLAALTEIGSDDEASSRDLLYEAMFAAILGADLVQGVTLEQVAEIHPPVRCGCVTTASTRSSAT